MSSEIEDEQKEGGFLDTISSNAQLIFTITVLLTIIVGPIVGLVYFWHIIGPESMRWLDPEVDILKIESLFGAAFSFFTGVGISFLIRKK